MSATKRTLGSDNALSSKRTRQPAAPPRLCDLGNGSALFADKRNSSRAKERGYLRNRDASDKYEELEKRLFALFKDHGEISFPDEDWVFEVLPELESLEAETLDSLLAQAQVHAKYEKAARDLLLQERARLEASHAEEMRGLRVTMESEAARSEVGAEMRFKQLDDQAKEEQEELRAEAVERIDELERTVADLEEKLEAKTKECEELEEEAKDECERLREAGEAIAQQLAECKDETELKREASRKLKEEIIDNDRLTVANLNRIKNLEAAVDEHKAALEEAIAENEQLRTELSKSVATEDAEEEVGALRELLTERENQLIALTRRLAEAGEGPAYGRRDSFLDRLGSSMKSHLGSSSARRDPLSENLA